MSAGAPAESGGIGPGTVVADRFTVEGTLGTGGSAVVYRAHDRVLDRPVALKLLDREESSGVDHDRFAREIRLTARLVHPSIVPLFDSGWHGDRLYYVMPSIDGATLREVLAERGRLPEGEAVRLVGDVAEALSYAHAAGLVHRDIKPGNIFSVDGRAIVADFGIAHSVSVEASAEALTADGVSIGTVAYMSPEQALGERSLDGRADLYSLGCVLFELLRGEPPFGGATTMSVLSQHLSAKPEIAARIPDASPAIVRLIEALLAKDPGDRPATAAAVIELLRPVSVRQGAPLTPVTEPRASEAGAAVAPKATTEVERTLTEARRLYNQGVQGGSGTKEVLYLARVLAEKVLAAEPQHVGAMAVLADIILCQGFRGFADEAETYNEAQRIRMEAVAIDDSVGELQTSIGIVRLYWNNDFLGAERYLERGAALAPHDGSAQRHYSTWLKMAGRHDESLHYVQRAVALMPDSPHAHVALADVLMSGGRYVEAIAPLQSALRLIPGYTQAMERLEMSCHRAGRYEDAFASRRTLLGGAGLFERLDRLSQNFERDGWEVARELDLRSELEELVALAGAEDPFKDRQTSRQLSDRIIILSGELGDWKRAMDWVERGYFVRPGRLIRVLTDLPFDRRGLASDPRYARLLRTAGLESLL